MTSNKIKQIEITNLNQQQSIPIALGSAAAVLIENLVEQQLNRVDAIRLAQEKPEECQHQLNYLPFKISEIGGEDQFRTGKGAYLRRAIEQEFAPPKSYQEHQLRIQKQQKAETQARQRHEKEARQERLRPEYFAYLKTIEGHLKTHVPRAHEHFQAILATERQKAMRMGANAESMLRKQWLLGLDGGLLWADHLLAICSTHQVSVQSFVQWEHTYLLNQENNTRLQEQNP